MRAIAMAVTGMMFSAVQALQGAAQAIQDPNRSDVQPPSQIEADEKIAEYLSLMEARLELVEIVGRLEARDQYVRRVMIDLSKDPDMSPEARDAFRASAGQYISEIDAANTEALQDALIDVSWRTLAEDPSDLFRRAFRIVQHSEDDAYQAEVLNEIEPLARERLVEGQLFALMSDRVQLKQDGTQLYGTQYTCMHGEYQAQGLLDPDTVDDRRAALGMEPMADYLATARELYGPC